MSLRWSFLLCVLNFSYKYFALPELRNVFVKYQLNKILALKCALEKSQRDVIFIDIELWFKKEPQRGEIYRFSGAFYFVF